MMIMMMMITIIEPDLSPPPSRGGAERELPARSKSSKYCTTLFVYMIKTACENEARGGAER